MTSQFQKLLDSKFLVLVQKACQSWVLSVARSIWESLKAQTFSLESKMLAVPVITLIRDSALFRKQNRLLDFNLTHFFHLHMYWVGQKVRLCLWPTQSIHSIPGPSISKTKKKKSAFQALSREQFLFDHHLLLATALLILDRHGIRRMQWIHSSRHLNSIKLDTCPFSCLWPRFIGVGPETTDLGVTVNWTNSWPITRASCHRLYENTWVRWSASGVTCGFLCSACQSPPSRWNVEARSS